MDVEHQHERRLPDADSDSDGIAHGHTGYPNSNADSHTGYPNSNPDSYANGNAHSDRATDSFAHRDRVCYGNPFGHALRHHGLHVCERGAHHHQRHGASHSLPEQYHGLRSAQCSHQSDSHHYWI